MCSRFSTDFSLEDLLLLGLPGKRLQTWHGCSGDARPDTEQVALVCPQEPLVTTMIWGWDRPWSSRKIINCRMEKAVPSGLWHEALRERRCLLPASAWWEKDSRSKKTWWKFSAPGKFFFLAGLFEILRGIPRFSLLTRPAEKTVLSVHPRMPVPFSQSQGLRWIRGECSFPEALDMATTSSLPLVKEPVPLHRNFLERQKNLFSPIQHEKEEEAP
ncbi:MAG TPA: SOS response-associated peptidase family protein [Synergistaceae bacterium]|nr:SOS response-associated peptidase family protein [Synergistaceae bacterium]